jgi:N-formylglutamate deformylase
MDGGAGAAAMVVAGGEPATPVLVHVPHAGTHIPADVRARLRVDDDALAAEVLALTDHRTDELAADVATVGASRVVARASRLVVDPERFLDRDREEMEQVGMGAVYTRGAWGERLRDDDPDHRAALLARYFHPHHRAVEAEVDRLLARFGRCVVVDLHSYPTATLPYELHGGGRRPPLCVGTDPDHTPDGLLALVVDAAADAGLATAVDTPFAGTFVPTRHLGDRRITSVMLEFRRDTHLDERTAVFHDGAAAVRDLVTEVARRVGSWTPTGC